MSEKDVQEEEPSIAEETMKQCKMLYRQRHLPCTKTCMCWGWECEDGWSSALRNLSCSLEVLNIMFYDKYKVRIQADQVKEKFGTLHFYFSVICDNFTEEGLKANEVIDAFEEKKDSGYFGIKTVVDEPGRDVEETMDGKKIKVWHPPRIHREVTEHKDEYDVMKAEADKAYALLAEKGRYDPSDEQLVIMNYMESSAEKLVKEARAECYNTCELCGRQIGTDYSPRIATKGWIRYICKKCDEEIKAEMEKHKVQADKDRTGGPDDR